MGQAYEFKCKCGYSFTPFLGVGFMFVQQYNDVKESAIKGEFGEELKAFFAEHPEGAINAEVVVGRCKKCGKYESFPNLSMYLPINVEENEKGRWSVPVPSEGAAYVAPWDLEESYKLYETYQHKCKSCGGDMDILTEKDLVESGIICPECGKTIECGANIMWD